MDILNRGAFLYRQLGQGSETETKTRDLRAELLQAEAVHFAKKNGESMPVAADSIPAPPPKRLLTGGNNDGEADGEEEDPEAKRRRILEETRDIDADSELSGSESSDEDSDDEDEEDEAAELMRELEKIKKERLAQKEKEVCIYRPSHADMGLLIVEWHVVGT